MNIFNNIKNYDHEEIIHEAFLRGGRKYRKQDIQKFMGFIFDEMAEHIRHTPSYRIRFRRIGFWELKPIIAFRRLERIRRNIKIISRNPKEKKTRVKYMVTESYKEIYKKIKSKVDNYDEKNGKKTEVLFRFGWKKYKDYIRAINSGEEDPEVPLY